MAFADPATVFVQADAFDRAAARLRPGRGDATADVAPYLMTSAFACELYLKCLLLLAKGKYPQIHNLAALWNDLPADEAERVLRLHRRFYRDFVPDADDADVRFEAIVRDARDAFQISRYLFEGGFAAGASDGVPDLTPVVTAVRGRILALEPGLRPR